jgi:hypothetical protein
MTPTIPIAKQADPTQVESLRPLVEGRHCAVVGSAPLSTKKADIGVHECAVAVNGGIFAVDGPVHVWVVNSKAQDALGALIRPLHKLMLEQGRGRAVGHVLMLRGPKIASEQLTLTALAAMHCRHQSWSVVDKATKRWLEGELCDRREDKRPCSSGILAVAMALYAGAASVRLVGFSFKPGYHYLQKEQPQSWWRNHVDADKRALHALTSRYGERLTGDLVRQAVAA